MRRVLFSSALLLSSCSLLFRGLSAGDSCDEATFVVRCEDGVLRTCDGGALFEVDCGDNGCNEEGTACVDVCGDGAVTGAEECDPIAEDQPPCDLLCQRLPVCGDGEVDFPERCDDQNTTPGDGCDASCNIEPIPEREPNDDFILFNREPTLTQDAVIQGAPNSFMDHDFFPVQNTSSSAVSLRVDLYDPSTGLRNRCRTNLTNFDDRQSHGLTALDSQGQVLEQFEDRGDFTGKDEDECPGGDLSLDAGETVYLLVATITPYLLEVDFDGSLECGDGDVDVNEDCEPPGTPSCDLFCKQLAFCGDGVVFGEEECDDGAVSNGDGCDASCQREGVCGDGFVDAPEECDDGDTTSGDGCSSSCTAEESFDEIEPNEDGTPEVGVGDFSTTNANPVTVGTTLTAQLSPAGDEDVFSIENTTGANVPLRVDLFSRALGLGAPCVGSNTDTVLFLRNENGVELAFNDDRAGGSDLCSGVELLLAPSQTVFAHVTEFQDNDEIPGYFIVLSNAALSVCGDGNIRGSEECDDGNQNNGDGCGADCTAEAFVVEVEPNDTSQQAQGIFSEDVLIRGASDSFDFFQVQNTTAQPRSVEVSFLTSLPGLSPCNGITLFPEAFDATTGASINMAQIQRGPCPGLSFLVNPGQSVAFSAFSGFSNLENYLMKLDFSECGNSVIEIDEECDPPGNSSCDAQCQRIAVCGDGFVDSPETCDDVNTQNGDGCNASCQMESSFGVLESEPNDDARPTVEFFQFDVVGNDFSEENSQGPFPGVGSFTGSLNPSGDEDFYAIQNPNDVPVSVRLDTYHPVLGVGQSCGASIDTTIILRDELGLVIGGGQDRIGDGFGVSGGVAQPGFDLCAGLRVDFAPQQTIYVQVSSATDATKILGYLLTVQIEEPVCGDGILTLPETCDGGADCGANCQLQGLLQEVEPNEDGSPQRQTERIFLSDILDGNDFSVANAQGPITEDTLLQGALHPSGDEDVFAIQNNSAVLSILSVELFYPQNGVGVSCGGGVFGSVVGERPDLVVTFRDLVGNPLAQNNNRTATDICPTLTLLLTPGQTIFAHLTDRGDRFELSSYLLRVRFSSCGDGNISLGEECEPPNSTSCDAQCQRVPLCGDGFLDSPEFCDDGNLFDGDGCSALCESEGASCPAGQALLQVSSTDVPKDIPDDSPTGVTSFININNASLVKSASVHIGDITHTFDGDLQISLLSPFGTEVPLMRNRGSNGQNIIGATFSDTCGASGGPIGGGSAPFTGCFTPESPLSVFNDQPANGEWELKIVDVAPPDIGTLNAWSLLLCVEIGSICGNGQLQPGEECEPPNSTSCDAQCQRVPLCGDGFLDSPEECDDGNLNNNDGCSASCLIEFCGDGVVQSGEQCDDNNNLNNDGCDNDCIRRADLTESEPNDDGAVSPGGLGIDGNDFSAIAANGPFDSDVTIFGALSPIGDEDVFAISNPSTTSSQEVRFDLFSASLGLGVACDGGTDTGLTLRDSAGVVLAQNDDRTAQDRCSGLTFTLAPNQTVFAQIVEFKDDAVLSGYFLVVDFP